MSKCIFIVDDSTTARMALKSKLEGHGYEIIEAVDGLDATRKLTGREVDLLITDYDMPNMNGLDLARSVRRMEGKNFLPILIMTSHKEDRLKDDAKTLGVAGWLDKAVDMTRLPKMVNLLIGS
ncbi:MAG: hypothetical protein C0615_12305 [Desulfuromonas sp.]|nr:MAG: hypothetical protein C0615_12305 [Desulfuromonas sp.]